MFQLFLKSFFVYKIQAFGLVKGQNVALLVDASDSNCGYGRLQLFQESLSVDIILSSFSFCVLNSYKNFCSFC